MNKLTVAPGLDPDRQSVLTSGARCLNALLAMAHCRLLTPDARGEAWVPQVAVASSEAWACGPGAAVRLADDPAFAPVLAGQPVVMRDRQTALGESAPVLVALPVGRPGRAPVAVALLSGDRDVSEQQLELAVEQAQLLAIALGQVPEPSLLATHLSEGVLCFDAHGRLAGLNPAASRLLGPWGLDPVATWHHADAWCFPDGSPMPPEQHPAALARRHMPFEQELRLVQPQSPPRHVLVRGVATPDGYTCLLEDRTRLRRRELELATLYNLAADSLGTDDPAVFLDRVLESILELSHREAGLLIYRGTDQDEPLVTQRRMPDTLLAATRAFEREHGMAALYACLAGKEPYPAPTSDEAGLLTLFTAGVGRWMVLPLHRGNRPNGLLLLARAEYHQLSDNLSRLLSTIINQLLISMERYQSFLEMEKLVAVRTAELRESHRQLEATVEELQRMDRFKTDFLSNVSHELRTPLSSIIGYGEFLAEGVYGDLSEDQNGVLDCLVSNSYHLMELINNLLDLSRLDAGKLLLYREPIEASILFQQAVGKVLPQALQKHITLELPDPPAPTIDVDPGRIVQVLVNLLANAIKFTPEGGKVSILATSAGDTLTVAVSDTGIGIAPDHLPRLFQRFSQGDSSTTRRFGGTGLGLAISRELMELHEQQIWVESQLGEGSTFYITLPIWQASTPAIL